MPLIEVTVAWNEPAMRGRRRMPPAASNSLSAIAIVNFRRAMRGGRSRMVALTRLHPGYAVRKVSACSEKYPFGSVHTAAGDQPACVASA